MHAGTTDPPKEGATVAWCRASSTANAAVTGSGDCPEWKVSANGVEPRLRSACGGAGRPENGDNGNCDRGIGGVLQAFPGDDECGRWQNSAGTCSRLQRIPIGHLRVAGGDHGWPDRVLKLCRAIWILFWSEVFRHFPATIYLPGGGA